MNSSFGDQPILMKMTLIRSDEAPEINKLDQVHFILEALISQNLTCHTTGIIYKVEEFRSPVSLQQCWNCQSFGHSAKTCRSKTKCVICGESHHHKGCPNREKKQPKCANCKGPHVASYKGCPAYKKQAFRQHVVDNQKSYASILRQNTAPSAPG